MIVIWYYTSDYYSQHSWIRLSGLSDSELWKSKSFRQLVESLQRGVAPHKASTYTGEHNIEECRHMSIPMPSVEFEPVIPGFNLSKTI
jgi:hypothetical protein